MEEEKKNIFSNKEMVEASQVAYLSFLEKSKRDLESRNIEGPYTIRDLIINVIDFETVKNDYKQHTGKNPDYASLKDLLKFSDLPAEDLARIELFNENVFDYKMIDITDLNEQTGFYACTMETSSNNAIIAFRGSESDTTNNFIKDWIKADFGLVNSNETEQQKLAEIYAELISEKMAKYENIGVTGHSLGGNLAEHFTIKCAKEGREELYNKIKQCDSLDGPGFSEKYVSDSENLKLCNKVVKDDNKITHYKWSLVGSMLYDLPFEKTKYLDVDESQHNEPDKDSLIYKLFGRHATTSLIFDKEGNAKEGKQDNLAKATQVISRGVDITNSFFEKHLLPITKGIASFVVNNIKSPLQSLVNKGREFVEEFINNGNDVVLQFADNMGKIVQNEAQNIQQQFSYKDAKESVKEYVQEENNLNINGQSKGEAGDNKILQAIKQWGITTDELKNFVDDVMQTKNTRENETTKDGSTVR